MTISLNMLLVGYAVTITIVAMILYYRYSIIKVLTGLFQDVLESLESLKPPPPPSGV